MKKHRLFFALPAIAALTFFAGNTHADEVAASSTSVSMRSAYVAGEGAIRKNAGVKLADDASLVKIPVALKNTGKLALALKQKLPAGEKVSLEVTVDGHAYFVSVEGRGEEIEVPVANLEINKPKCLLVSVRGFLKTAGTFGEITGLALSGPAAQDAIVEVRRNALSVHFWYDTGDVKDITWFYNEVAAPSGPTATFYMACGFHRGYFGIQRNSDTERRVIFSVWDSGGEAVSRSKVEDDNRVKLVAKSSDVYTGDFGNEGTGGHSHLKYQWKDGETCRFLLGAKPDGNKTVFAGYFFMPETKTWKLISAWRAPKDGGHLRGLYSFVEDYWGDKGDVRRGASYGNAWAFTDAGTWKPLPKVTLTNNNYPGRTDYGCDLVNNRFVMYTGGYLPNANLDADPNSTAWRKLEAKPETPPAIDFEKLEWPEFKGK